ncbi:uncharacterized protein LOC130013559, partial [Patella vulgata]|uniref:uncharacterized protein LOC130013559 n=1 Tax=Patella vulgata TaxID=6465 RepID=UPI0024A9C411
LALKSLLNLSNIFDLSFWVACLIGFFGLLRPDLQHTSAFPLLVGNDVRPLSFLVFLNRLKMLLRCAGFTDADYFSGHSFRRGGAQWAAQSGIPVTMIQELGFWKSTTYLRYLHTTDAQKFRALTLFTRTLPPNLGLEVTLLS